MSNRLILGTAAVLCAGLWAGVPADAKKLPETHSLQKNAGPAEEAFSQGNLRRSTAPGTPEQRARDFLAGFQGLGLKDAAGADLRLHAVREGLSGTTVRFHQYVGGLRVYGAEVVVTYNHRGEVRTVNSTYRGEAELPALAQSVSAEVAEAAALEYLGVGVGAGLADRLAVEVRTSSIVDVLDGRSYLAHRVELHGYGPLEGWRILVDAADGTVRRAVDTRYYVDGSGRAFLPDPLSSATADYSDPGYSDDGDADSPEKTAESPLVTLRDITENGGTYTLLGPWAEQVDWDAPFKGNFSQNSTTWDFTRENDAFEAVNVYYHIDTYMRYLNDTLGLDLRPYQYAGGVQYDPSGADGLDNSFYTSGSGRLSFGEGGVDDAEDADVVIHELGHGLHDWVTSGGLSQNEGLSEGVGDYAAVAYSRSFANQWTPSDPEYNWTFSWDGHNPFWNGRVTNWNDTRTYPDDLGPSIHSNGQFWASCNIDILEQIGAAKTDTAHWEGLARTGGSTNQEQAAQAVLDAASDLGYSASDLTVMLDVYTGCGYDVTVVINDAIFEDNFEDGSLGAWGQVSP